MAVPVVKGSLASSREWHECCLGEIASVKTGKLNACAAVQGGRYPFFTCSERPLFINDAAYDSESVLVAGNCTPYVNYYKGKFNAYQRTYIITPKSEKVSTRWLYFWMRHQIKFMITHQLGSVEKYFVLSDFTNRRINLPPLETQKRIAAILSSLDDKIENNKRINRHLEQMAQALFKSWFVDFTPFGGVCPKTWTTSSLAGIANYLNGLAMQKFSPKGGEKSFPVLKIKELRQGCCDVASDRCSTKIRPEYVVYDGDVVFSWSGSLLVDFWCGGLCGLNQHLFKVTSEQYDKWFYYAWTHFHLPSFIAMAADKATTMGHIKRKALEEAEVLVPDAVSYRQIGKCLAPVYEQIIANRIESHRLAELRDTVLPCLMSGNRLTKEL